MPIQRYSAVEMFGAPIEGGVDPESLHDMVQLMEGYSIEGQEIPPGTVDITPPYGVSSSFLYYLTREEPDGLVVVDLLPRTDNSRLTDSIASSAGVTGVETPLRSIIIPAEQPGMALAGTSPRFTGKLCLHELIVDTDQL